LRPRNGRGARILFLPECFSMVGSRWQDTVAAGQSLDGEVISACKEMARTRGLWLSLGGFPEAMPDASVGKVYNTHIIVDNDGEIRGVYRKIHLFDVVSTQSGVQTAVSDPLARTVLRRFRTGRSCWKAGTRHQGTQSW
jgi:predicted amidohydrolase